MLRQSPPNGGEGIAVVRAIVPKRTELTEIDGRGVNMRLIRVTGNGRCHEEMS